MERLDKTYFFNELGFYDVASVDRFGNFTQSALSNAIRVYLEGHQTQLVDAVVNHQKSQYRAFFSDGTGFYATIVNGKLLGYAFVEFPRAFSCVWNGINENGLEVTLAGDAEDGLVYQLDIGGSFDGKAISAYLDVWDDVAGSPRMLKTYRRATVFVYSEHYVEFEFGYSLGFNRSGTVQPSSSDICHHNDTGIAPFWDSASMVWDKFTWDGGSLDPIELELAGNAEAVSFRLQTCPNRAWIEPFIIGNITYDYTPRRTLRG